MQYVRVGLSGFFAPTCKKMNQVLTVLEDSGKAPIFIHCRRGADRSGMVVACYRIAHDHWTNVEAMQEARDDGLSRFEVLMQIFVRHFRPQPSIVQQ
jgi:protein tyrosine/serine phosphatase